MALSVWSVYSVVHFRNHVRGPFGFSVFSVPLW